MLSCALWPRHGNEATHFPLKIYHFHVQHFLFLSLSLVHALDPDGKERQIYYKADKAGYQVSYDKPFDLPSESDSERLTDLSRQYLPPRADLIQDVLKKPSRSYLPPNK